MRINKSNIYYLSIFILIFTVLYFPYLDHQKIYLFFSPNSDYLIGYWPYKKYILDIIRSHDIINNVFLLGSGLGNNIFSVKMLILDPFNIISLFDASNFLIIWQYLLKLIVIFILVYKILSFRTGNNFYSAMFSMLFAYNGMFIFWSTQDYHFTAIVFMVMQWFGYELYRKSEKIRYFIALSLPLFMLSTIYWAIVFNLFFVLFITLDIIWDPKSQKTSALIKILLAYIIVFLISAWSILPELWILDHNARVKSIGGLSSFLHTKFETNFGILEPLQLFNLRLYAQFIIRGFGNFTIPFDKIWVSPFSGPLWYSSSFLLISAFAYIISNIRQSHKVLLNSIISISVLFLFFPLVILVFNGMSDIRMRWSWFILLPLTICATKYWVNNPDIRKLRISLYFLATTFIVAAAYEYFVGDLYFTNKFVKLTYFEIIICFVMFYILSFTKKYTFLLLMLVAISDLLFQNYAFILNASSIDRNYLSNKQYYYDNTIKTIDHIKQNDKAIFYRIDKTYSSINLCQYCGLNENMIQGYLGIKSYISTPNPAYFSFNQDMDAKPYYNFIFGFNERYDVLKMLGVKYILSHSLIVMPGYKLQEKYQDTYIYIAQNYQGIGHIFHNYISYDEFITQPRKVKDKIFSRCLVLPKSILRNKQLNNSSLDQCTNLSSILQKEDERFILKEMTGRYIKGDANLLTSGILYLALPFDYGFTAKVDGKVEPIFNVGDGFIGIALSNGKHYIEINYIPPLLGIGLLISSMTILLLACLVIYKKNNQ